MQDEGKRDVERRRGASAARLMADLFDGLDRDRAIKLRFDLGLKGWIVSWEPLPGDLWLARVSVSRVARTVERVGRTRAESIGRAVGSLGAILEMRSKRTSLLSGK